MVNMEKRTKLMAPENLYELLMVDATLKKLLALVKDRKAEMLNAMQEGESVKIFNPRGAQIGSLSKSARKNVAVIEDMAAALPTLAEKYELEDTLPEPGTAEFDEAVAYLQLHAPEVLTLPQPGTKEYVDAVNIIYDNAPELLGTPTLTAEDAEQAAEDVLETWNAGGDLPAGWQIKTSGRAPSVSIRTNKTGKAAVEIMLTKATSLFEIDGMKRALESGEK